MVKSIIKEIMIILLLIAAILLVLSILFYEYRPSAKKIPAQVKAYVLPEEMQEELNVTVEGVATQNIIKTYKVDSSDLKKYEKTNDYDKGKVNPFEEISTSNTVDVNPPSDGGFLNEVK